MVGPWSCILLDEFHRHVFEVRGISPYRQWCTTDLARSLASSCFFGTAWHGHAMVFGSRHFSQKAQTQTTTYFSLQFHKPRQCGKEAHRFQWHFLGHHHDRETVELSAKEVLVRWGAFTVASVFLQVAGFGFGSNLFKWPSGLWLSRGGGMIWESVSVSHVITCHVKVFNLAFGFRAWQWCFWARSSSHARALTSASWTSLALTTASSTRSLATWDGKGKGLFVLASKLQTTNMTDWLTLQTYGGFQQCANAEWCDVWVLGLLFSIRLRTLWRSKQVLGQ